MKESLLKYRIQMRHFLKVSGIAVMDSGGVCCPNPGHPDSEFCSQLIEDKKEGDRISCEICATSWDLLDVEGFLSGLENTRSTFPRRLESIKTKLATVLPEHRPSDDKPLVELTDEELYDLKSRQREATRETAANRQRIRDEASDLQERERRKVNDAREKDLPFRIYGVASDGFAYFEDRHGRLVSLRLGSLTKTQLQLLAPITWWVQQFEGGRGRLRVDDAIDFLIEMANAKSFELSSLRGRGCWREE